MATTKNTTEKDQGLLQRFHAWKLSDAKARFSEVVKRALADEPQLVTRSGRAAVYVVAAESYDAERAGDGLSRKDILQSSPCREIELDMSRDTSGGREVAL